MIKSELSKKVQSLRNLQRNALSHLLSQILKKILNLKKKNKSSGFLKLKRRMYILMILILMFMRGAKKGNRRHLGDQLLSDLQLRRKKKRKLTLNP